MRSSALHDRSMQALKLRLETISNLIYLSRHTETRAQRHAFLDQAANIMAEIAHHPQLEE
jgi:hypothetical protein